MFGIAIFNQDADRAEIAYFSPIITRETCHELVGNSGQGPGQYQVSDLVHDQK